MEKSYLTGMQADAAVRIGTSRTIFQVAFDGAADGCELAADLMVAAGEQFNFYKKIIFSRTQQAVPQQSFLCTCFSLRVSHV